MEYTVRDIVAGAFNDEPNKIKDAFEYLLAPKIMDALEQRKQDIANAIFNRTEIEDSNTEAEEDETEDNESASEVNQAA